MRTSRVIIHERQFLEIESYLDDKVRMDLNYDDMYICAVLELEEVEWLQEALAQHAEDIRRRRDDQA